MRLHPPSVVLSTFFAFVLTACASAPDTTVKTRDNFQLSQIDTYAVVPYRVEGVRGEVMSNANRNQIEYTIETVLDSEGLVLTEKDEASIWVNYFIVGGLSILFDYNRSIRACYECKSLSYKSGKKHDPGTLIIDLVNPETGRSVWRGVAPKAVDFKKNEFENTERVGDAIRRLLTQLFAHDIAKDSNYRV